MAERGALVRVRHGVYANIATTLSAELEVKAQWLALRPELMAAERVSDPVLAAEAVVSHTTAAEMWWIGDLWPDGIHFTVSDRRRSRQLDVRFHRAYLADADWVVHPEIGLLMITVARTIADLVQDGHETDHLLTLVADAGRKSLLEEDEMLDALAGHEDPLGVDRGDRRGLKTLLEDYFPEDRVVRRARQPRATRRPCVNAYATDGAPGSRDGRFPLRAVARDALGGAVVDQTDSSEGQCQIDRDVHRSTLLVLSELKQCQDTRWSTESRGIQTTTAYHPTDGSGR